ncbi:MAG: hypothetical protein KDK34_24125 [Leptospiraceae bacterium]|nr:hypothetical protein [Leptospiraceae bacterium]
MTFIQDQFEQSIYIAPPGFRDALVLELGHAGVPADKMEQYGHLIIAPALQRPMYWVQNIWRQIGIAEIESTGDAARILRGVQRNWWPYTEHFYHRCQLIQKRLPRVSNEPIDFKAHVNCGTADQIDSPATPEGKKAWGAFALLDQNRLVYSAHTSSPFPGGEVSFKENNQDPPGRAYLKLWESFTRLGRRPAPGEHCLDVGAAPGSWTWVLVELGCRITSIDRAALTAALMHNARVRHIRGNAFQLKPEDVDPVDWLCSDIVCSPDRLYDWLQPWLASGRVRNYICTLKMQGQPDFKTIDRFAALPGSLIVHLNHNKHELTWMCVSDS